MAIPDIDFEGSGSSNVDNNTTTNPADNGNLANNQNEVDDIHGSDVDDINKKDESTKEESNNQVGNSNESSSTGELEEGVQLDIDGKLYTVDANGNIVDDKGEIFKEAKDVKDWLKSVDVSDDKDDETNLDVNSIKDALGFEITDADGKPVEFTNNLDGVKSLVNSVIDIRSKELQEAAINKLYQDNPLLKQFQDYVQLNGTPCGFGDIPDRSGIQLDKDNKAQLVAVIKMAAQEFGNKSLTDSYIKYLDDSGSLYAEAQNQLNALVEKDNKYRKDLEAAAARQREEEFQSVKDYWKKVNDVVNSRNINGYRIPESITKEVNGQKVVLTTNDFFNYLSVQKQTEDGSYRTAYQSDLDKLTDEEYLNREILDAWLMFTGGTYKDLIAMAVNEDKVRQLKIRAKEHRSSKTVKVIKPAAKRSSIDDIVLQ